MTTKPRKPRPLFDGPKVTGALAVAIQELRQLEVRLTDPARGKIEAQRLRLEEMREDILRIAKGDL